LDKRPVRTAHRDKTELKQLATALTGTVRALRTSKRYSTAIFRSRYQTQDASYSVGPIRNPFAAFNDLEGPAKVFVRLLSLLCLFSLSTGCFLFSILNVILVHGLVNCGLRRSPKTRSFSAVQFLLLYVFSTCYLFIEYARR